MMILGVETSCDETAAAIVEDGVRIRSNVVASQVELHARYGGIVPEIASRQHVLEIVPVLRRALEQAGVEWSDIDAVAMTVGPGLAGALLVGINASKAIALARGIPLLAVNHLEAHIYSNWLPHDDSPPEPPDFPLVCLIASGGHTDLILMRGHGDYVTLGRTRDDAAGEAFDKVARILDLGYPGGPAIQRVAETANKPERLPRAWLKDTHDFSFSGLKTATLHLAQDRGVYPHTDENGTARSDTIANIAAGFQEAVVDVLVKKTVAAARKHRARHILLAGGVAANGPLRESLAREADRPLSIPPMALCTDNAAMVAACGHALFQRGVVASLDVDVQPSMPLGG